jgi:hypothetical protein
MKSNMSYGDPEALAKKRALEHMALTPLERYEALMHLIKLNYEIRESKKASELEKGDT